MSMHDTQSLRGKAREYVGFDGLVGLLVHTVAFHPELAELPYYEEEGGKGKVKGKIGILGALMLSQALYWQSKTNDPEGWFWKTQGEWQEELSMSRYEQETARKRLRHTPFWQEVRRGLPARMYFRVDLGKLDEEARKLLASRNKNVESPQTTMGNDHKQERGNAADLNTKSSPKNSAKSARARNVPTESDSSNPTAFKPPAAPESTDARDSTEKRGTTRKKARASGSVDGVAHRAVVRYLATRCGLPVDETGWPTEERWQGRLFRVAKNILVAERQGDEPWADVLARLQTERFPLVDWALKDRKVWAERNGRVFTPPTPEHVEMLISQARAGTLLPSTKKAARAGKGAMGPVRREKYGGVERTHEELLEGLALEG